MNYDPQREIDKVENRIQIQIDRRFIETDRRFNEIIERLRELKVQIEAIDTKVDNNTTRLEDRQYEKSTWTIRQIITIIISFILGGGAIGMVQAIVSILTRK